MGTNPSVAAVAVVVVAIAAGGGCSKREPTREQVNVLPLIKSEPKVLEARWASAGSLWVWVADDGSRRDGYAQYVCEVLRLQGVAQGVTVRVQKAHLGNQPITLGKAHCRS